ncbi:MAG: hypothetical protein HN867_04610 [Deltaproteobacteria bacterium]|mgnify:FL=1|jgi:hypothetical protein|nr:hypothetical protein [Deltaproteobacteria bacterium]MBT7202759.1 hypothetical protein [Deltaproteobacteria bacterium]
MKLKLSLDVIYEFSPEVIKELAIEFGSRDDVLKELYSRLEQDLVGYFAEEIHEDLLEETEVSFDSTTTKIYSVELLEDSGEGEQTSTNLYKPPVVSGNTLSRELGE